MIPSRPLRALVSFLLITRVAVKAQQLTDAQVNVISLQLAESAKQSWELGTRAQTILERNATTYSVFSKQHLPPPSNPNAATLSALQPFFDIANNVVSSLPNNHTGPQPLIPGDGSAADPASIGVCVLITNWTKAANGGSLDYAGAATSQIEYLFTAVPRTSDGAISHMVSQVQLWSDFVYMVPPFLAYYGVMTHNQSMVVEAYNQIKLYRNYLRDPTQSMWRHVLLGQSGNDPGFWSTGNAWAAAGMLRVYATIQNSQYASALQSELQDLANWVQEIHTGMYRHLDNTNLFANYADTSANSSGNFYDASSTALLASTVYRAAQILGQNNFVSYAEKSRKALSASNSTSSPQQATSSLFPSYAHFTTGGVLFPVVDPYSVGVQGTAVSPEGQAFVVLMNQAWEDWTQMSKTKSGERSSRRSASIFGSKNFVLFGFFILICLFI